MRKVIALGLVFVCASYFGAFELLAQDAAATKTGFQVLKEKFIEGD